VSLCFCDIEQIRNCRSQGVEVFGDDIPCDGFVIVEKREMRCEDGECFRVTGRIAARPAGATTGSQYSVPRLGLEAVHREKRPSRSS
jgi:hypothetical protein